MAKQEINTKEKLSSCRSFRQQLEGLSQKDNPRALIPVEVEAIRNEIRQTFIDFGFDLESIEKDPFLIQSLQKNDFRDLTGGMGPAVAVALDGKGAVTNPQILNDTENFTNDILRQQKTMVLRAISQDFSQNMPALDSGTGYSQRRGLEKLFAYTVAFAVTVPGTDQGVITAQKYCQKVNWMAGADIERPLEKETNKAKKLKDKTNKPEDISAWEVLKAELKSVRDKFGIPHFGDKDGRINYSGHARVPQEKIVDFFDQILMLGKTPKDQLADAFPQVSPKNITRVDLLGNDYLVLPDYQI